MSFRLKVLLVVLFSVGLSIALVAWQISASARRSFEQLDADRTAALVAQFQNEMRRREREIDRQLEAIAASEVALKIALENSRGLADLSPFAHTAPEVASAHGLDLLQFISADGTIISSAQWPARFGYKDLHILDQATPRIESAFLKQEELADSTVLGLVKIRVLQVRDRNLYIVGGRTLDAEFVRSLVLPAGTRVMLYRPKGDGFFPENLLAAAPVADPTKLGPLVQRVEAAQRERKPVRLHEVIRWSGDPAEDETVAALPLLGRNGGLEAMLLIGTSHRPRVEMARSIRNAAFLIGGSVMLLGLVLAAVVSRRVTRPVEELAEASDRVAAGDWETEVAIEGNDEVARLATAFNRMTRELITQRERLVQTERVAAWRELARRLAHELKNPLFPLQITVENLLRARQHSPQEFDEVFRESTSTLLAEISNLKAIIGRFSDFSKMPAPQLQPVQLNDVITDVGKLFAAQFQRGSSGKIEARYDLAADLPPVAADPVLIRRAIENLVLNALDAMPEGGTLTFRTCFNGDRVRFELSDSGAGMTPEECERLFTPYYTTKQHGTGLGLAIVQSVISDHNGRIWVTSQKGRGATFHVELPLAGASGANDTMQAATP